MRVPPLSLLLRLHQPTRTAAPDRSAVIEPLESRTLLSRGLIGYYFADTEFTQVQFNRIDETIDFNWTSAPSESTEADGFGARWSGRVLAKFTETYRFYTRSTGGVRLWVDGQLIIDHWTTHPIKDNKGEVALKAGVRHDIRVEYFDTRAESFFQIHWASPRQQRELLPTNRLFASDPDTTPPSTVFKLRPSYVTDTAMKFIWSPAVDDSDTLVYDVYIGRTRLGATTQTEFYRAGRMPDTSYNVTVRSIDFAGNVTISDPVTITTLPVVPFGEGTGLAGMYYRSGDFTNFAMTRTDPQILLNGGNLPFQDAAGEPLTARWTGTLTARYDEVHRFTLATSGGVRMWVGGKLLIDAWDNGAAAQDHASMRLRAGQAYSIRIDYRNGGGEMQLAASYASFSTQPRLIDTAQLTPAFKDTVAPTAPGNLRTTSINGSSIALSWNPSVDDVGIVRYDVYRDGALLGSTQNHGYIDAALQEDTQYTYTVRAVDGADRVSPFSNAVSARTTSVLPRDALSMISAVEHNGASGVVISGDAIASLDDGDWVRYRRIDFGSNVKSLKIKLGAPVSNSGGRIDVRIGSPTGQLIGSHTIQPTGAYGTRYWQQLSISGVSGRQDLYFVFNGAAAMGSIEGFQFSTKRLLRIMPLGDSITVSDSTRDSYRYYLYHKLANAGYAVDFVGSQTLNRNGAPASLDFDQNHESHSGWRVDQVLTRINAWMAAAKPDVVLIHLGTNDIWQGQSAASTVAEMGQLIDAIRAYNPSVKIVLAQIIPLNHHQAKIAEFNEGLIDLVLGKQSLASPLVLVDMFSSFNLFPDTYDGVHPSTQGEIKMAHWFYDALVPLLS